MARWFRRLEATATACYREEAATTAIPPDASVMIIRGRGDGEKVERRGVVKPVYKTHQGSTGVGGVATGPRVGWEPPMVTVSRRQRHFGKGWDGGMPAASIGDIVEERVDRLVQRQQETFSSSCGGQFEFCLRTAAASSFLQFQFSPVQVPITALSRVFLSVSSMFVVNRKHEAWEICLTPVQVQNSPSGV
uniref:DUF834 domain-containing protein n=1 Tax=Oryza glumipatula TaxID=40148 RepID=A0A0E0B7K8_9ORYZ